MDNNNKKVRVVGNSLLKDNAQYSFFDNRDYITFGTSTVGNIYGIPAGINYASLEIGGHEFTHGIIKREANLIYEGEPGALNESFADIFGTMIERYARGGNSNWTCGEDLGFVLRNMRTPSAGFRPQPRTYLSDPFWVGTVGCVPNNGNDDCGLHINSGVQNRWFYLLSVGGTQGGVNVQGIGMDKAALIAYTNLATFLGSNANYPAARLGGISAALQLYGACSNEVIQTTNAWAAVGVGPSFVGNCLTLEGERILCTKPAFFPYTYIANGLTGANFTWAYPPNWIGILSGPGNNTLTITSFGNYNPAGGFPANESIQVASSLGGIATILIKVYDGMCQQICRESGGENKSTLGLITGSSETLVANIYPNPTQTEINVSCGVNPPLGFSIFSALGTKLMEGVPKQSTFSLDVSKLPNGVCFIKIQFESRTMTKKFSKTN
jgi:Thermolysin metallopeptidase, alpha-helical domain/Secretion system C-terminal sorting domain